jgi:hypothetical protein
MMMFLRYQDLGNGWGMQIKTGRITIWKLCYDKKPLPFVFFSEKQLLDWADENGVNYLEQVSA